MKHLSIKMKMALWYAFSLLAILFLTGTLLLAAGNRLILRERKSGLISVTDRALQDVRITEGHLTIDEDISYYSDGVYIVIYDKEGTLLSGLEPPGYQGESHSFASDTVQKLRREGHSFYVYDRLIENQITGNIWVRGITSARLRDLAPSVMRMLLGFLIAIPLLFSIALIGGWILTKQAFLPLNRIVETADAIRKGGDLRQRIGLDPTENGDEIQRTAAMFDEMLEQIEKDFETEKQFTNQAGHELRTPLSVILAQSEYALENMSEPGEVKASLLEIRKQAGQMSSLVNQLLTIARADRGIDQLHKEPADISLLAEESAARFMTEAERRKIHIRVEAEECCYMLCDPVLIGRLYDNLIDNSLKYGKCGGTTEIKVFRGSASCTGTIHILIRDDGIGMAEKELPRIWERFYRIRPEEYISYKKGPSGFPSDDMSPDNNSQNYILKKEDEQRSVGLGLPMVKWIVEAHGGTITVDSHPEEGTEFHITFPE